MTIHLADHNRRHGVACNNRDAGFLPAQFIRSEPSEVDCTRCKATRLYGRLTRADRP